MIFSVNEDIVQIYRPNAGDLVAFLDLITVEAPLKCAIGTKDFKQTI